MLPPDRHHLWCSPSAKANTIGGWLSPTVTTFGGLVGSALVHAFDLDDKHTFDKSSETIHKLCTFFANENE